MTRYELAPLDSAWDTALMQMPNWNIFQTSTWMKTYTSVYFGKETAQGLVIESDGKVIGMLPMLILKRFGCRILGSPVRHWLTPFTGFAWNTSLSDCLLPYHEFCRKSRINYSTITFADTEATIFAKSNGYRTTAFKTAVTPLREDLDSLWKRIKGGQRNRIRKGEKSGFTLTALPSREIIGEYTRIRRELYHHQGIDSSLADTFLREISVALPSGSIRFFTAMDGSSLAAAAVLLLFRNTCYGWDTVSNPLYRKFSPGCAVHWQTMVWGHENGYEVLDWGGANTPTIAEYKFSYGAGQQNYVMIEDYSPASLSVVLDALRKYRNSKKARFRTKPAPTPAPKTASSQVSVAPGSLLPGMPPLF